MPKAASSSSTDTDHSIFSHKYYHVFLSFRGDDTRKGFTDHLYAALQRKGIVTFKDDQELKSGELILEKLMKAIEESMFAIVVLSEHYASSSWCLNELHKIVESRHDLDRTVFPVFYDVDPSYVRHQKGSIAMAFKKHEATFAEEKIQSWREALTKVANLTGWETKNRHEVDIIEDITAAVWTQLSIKLPSNFDHLLRIQPRANKLISLLKIELDHKCFIGIWGMGGTGKTTLARVVYEAIQSKFEITCFLSNIRENLLVDTTCGLVDLQKKLLSCLHQKNIEIIDSYGGMKAIRHFFCNKKVLIVLDDVSHIRQLENLAGNKDWFGDGSKIIVTTRDSHLLKTHGQFEKYEIETLNYYLALKLLCQKAFKQDYPEEGFVELSQKVVQYASGLPLALQVLGKFLCGRSQSEWRDMVDKMKKKQNLHKDILRELTVSFDGLEDEEYKTIFLDIACFFNRKPEVFVMKVLENCSLHPTIGINVLIEKSLLSFISFKKGDRLLSMHNLLQEMGKNIVLQESPNDASRRSRLWSQEEIDQVLKGNNGTEKVQSIGLNLELPLEANWHPDCFSNMRNLRLLFFRNVHLVQNSLNSLPSSLKVLIWEHYPLKALPQNIGQLYELVEITLCHSRIQNLWNGTPVLDKLKFIDLSHSKNLIETPDFSGVPNLESLILEGCTNLVKIHESMEHLKKLVKLNLKDCRNLVSFPINKEMNSLEEFIHVGCSKLGNLLDNLGKSSTKPHRTSCLCCVSFGNNHIEITPMALKLPDSLLSLSSLRELNLSFCNLSDGSIPEGFNGLSSLEKLDLRGNNFTNLSDHDNDVISKLVNLKYLDLSDCAKLQSIPLLPPNSITASASFCPSMKPLQDVHHLFASPLSKNRSLLLHEGDITLLHVQGNEIPTWFQRRDDHFSTDEEGFGPRVSIQVEIPFNQDQTNEWLRIGVCLVVNSREISKQKRIHWSFKAINNEEDQRFCQRSEREFYIGNGLHSPDPHLYIAFLPFNTHNCWSNNNLRGDDHGRQLVLSLRFNMQCDIKDYGWRLIYSS
ncbi:hypothetical protein K1719_013212 [Acacia pycnantha]|nr:hypothetical protein K1719_013212 [Acacia pycnantha]